jgi:hypothetical protein
MGLAEAFDFIWQFGKAPAIHDGRTLEFAAVCLEKDSLPEEYDFDEAYAARFFPGYKRKGIPTPKFGNIKSKNCVIAGRAHQTLRFELREQKRLIKIRTKDVLDEYHKEIREFFPDQDLLNRTGGDDRPIRLLDSLKLWRKAGWKVAGRTCRIDAFTRINKRDRERIKRAIHMKIGVGLGFMLPDSARTQFDAREPWDVVREAGERSKKGDGHYVYVSGYTKRGPVCVTWGRKQQISWAFVNKYCDEGYAIIDTIDTPGLDQKKIKKFLATCAPVLRKTDRVSPA